MTTFKVITGFSRYTDEDLEIQGQASYSALNPNANFNWDEEVMPRFLTKITDYQDSRKKVVGGTAADVLKKNQAKAALAGEMHYLAVAVNQQAANDLVKLQSSGFPLVKTRSKIGPLPKPSDFRVSSGRNSGELLFEVDSNPQCHVYLFFYAEMPAPDKISDMLEIVSTTHRHNSTGFIPGKQYKCLCAYRGSNTTLVYSDPVYIYAQ
jgi:hypothetical protein